MIRAYIPGLFESDVSSNDTRKGDCQIFYDGQFYDIIDGYCGAPAIRMVKRLKNLGIKNVYVHISHAHYDHYNGIERIIDDSYFNVFALYCYDPKTLNAKLFGKYTEENVAALTRIINKAKKRGIEVIFLKDGDKIIHGDTEIWVYRDQPETAVNADAYINDGSLCYYFPKLKYLTTGDAGVDCAKKHNLDVRFVSGGHHGNDFIKILAEWLWNHGCRFYWDNDYATTITDFLKTGRRHAINFGYTVLSIHGDINFVACNGKVTIYKGGQHWTYECGYKGKNTLKSPNLTLVENVIKGQLGSSDTRTTNLLDKGYSPVGVQNHVNILYKLIKG